MFLLFLESIFFGLIMAAPVGPVGVLCIQRSLQLNWRAGFVTGLGTALADGIFAFLAGVGLSSTSGAVAAHERPLRLVGGFILIGIGALIGMTKPPRPGNVPRETPVRFFVSGLIITMTNPMTIFSFAAVYVGLGLGAATSGDAGHTTAFVLGVFLGSCLWWLALSSTAARLRERVANRAMSWVNRACGGVIAVFGLVTLASLLWR